MIKQIITKGTMGLAATSMALVGFGGLASAQSQPTTQRYMTRMTSLNGSGASGTAWVSVTGDQATVMIQSKGLSANLPHAQHIHIGGANACPTLAADANHDGLISTSEGMDAYGDALIGLTTTGDVSVNSELAVDRYPSGSSNGTVTYKRTFTLPTGVTPADVAKGVVVQHGVSKLFNDPTMYDGSAMDTATSTTLPLEASIPADCGKLVPVTSFHTTSTNSNISETGPGSYNSVTSTNNVSMNSTNNTTVEERNQNSQTANTGSASNSGNTNSGNGSGSSTNTGASWGTMDPASWQANGQSFTSWWSAMMQQMGHYNGINWTQGNTATSNTSWSPDGSDWQSTWSNWNPSTWQSHGQSYGNWYGQMLGYMTGNYSNWMSTWNNQGNGVSSGNANNNNANMTAIDITNNGAGQTNTAGTSGIGSSSISETGPGSVNEITSSNRNSFSSTNRNTISSRNSNSQNARSGNANNSGNTFGGTANSGSAMNLNSSSLDVVVTNN